MDSFTVGLVSYVPLLVGEAGNTNLDMSEIAEIIDNTNATAKACIWLNSESGPIACLLYDDANNIANHLKAWSENKPEEWFKLVLSEYLDLYGLALMPNVNKGIERFKIAYQLKNGYPLPTDTEYEVLFKPLHFISCPGHVFSKVKRDVRNKVKVVLLEASEFTGPNTDFDKTHELGTFEVVTDGPYTKYVVDNLKASKNQGNG